MPMQPFPATTHYSTIIRSQTQQFELAACSGAALLKCFVPLQAYWFSYHMDGFISSVVRSFRYIRGHWHGTSLKSLTCVCNTPYFDSPPVRLQNGFFYSSQLWWDGESDTWSMFRNHVRFSSSPESRSVGTKAHSKLSVLFSALKQTRVFKRVFYNESRRAYTCLMLASLPVFSSLIMLSLALKSDIERRPLQRCFSPLECSIEEEDSI